METDLQAFLSIYKRFGIDCQVNQREDKQVIYFAKASDKHFVKPSKDSTFSSKFVGYSDFYSQIDFDLDGNFINQGFWE